MVTVALLVRIEAKPGKEAEVESFLRSGLPSSKGSQQRPSGSGFALDPRRSISSMRSRTRRAGKHTSRAASQRR
jgi:hypothetical protein